MTASMQRTVGQRTTVAGLAIHSQTFDGGWGAPLVMLPGLGLSSRYLLPTARALAPRFEVHLLDPPGCGGSERPARVLQLAEVADVVLGWLDAMGLARASFLANSLGCQILLEFAVRAPERVDRLVLVGPTVDPRWRSFARQVPRWLLQLFREPVSLLPTLIRDYFEFGPLRFLATARYALADRPEEKLPRVQAPTLVMRGERDAFVSAAWVQRCAELLPRGTVATVPGAAHAANYSAPGELAALVTKFLA